ncbi:uncharacterized protein BcabD6B2_30970 [Babesia caballi]|uniref:Uncharacterized protein n=1 Tax=Babesia caballi TaxID=5871 RepID=A0AAV4LV26_BABCB|nr:hypothetical protein BcabD6B2_30970 [Babesia caballi]
MISRQEGVHKSANTTDVEAVGATCKGGEARVAEEGGGGGAGGVDGVGIIGGEEGGGDYMAAGEGVHSTLKANGGHVLAEGGGTAGKLLFRPTFVTFAPPVEIRQAVKQHRPDAEEDEGTSSFVIGALRPSSSIVMIFGLVTTIFADATRSYLPTLITD